MEEECLTSYQLFLLRSNCTAAVDFLIPMNSQCFWSCTIQILGPGQQVHAQYYMIISLSTISYYAVTGEANFSMQRTSLTVGGFNQPSVARSLIELPGNAKKGLIQRFLWLSPKPVYSAFDSLEPIDKEFTGKLGMYIRWYKVLMYYFDAVKVTLVMGENHMHNYDTTTK